MIGTTINHPVAAQTRSSAVVEPAQMTPKVTLGSASPRRADLLRSLGVDFDVEVVELDEHAFIDELERDPRVLAETIARAKFAAFPANGTDRLLLTADTLVACNGSVMGKPTTNRRLTAMLASMSGRELEILRQPRSHTGGPRAVHLPEGWLSDRDNDQPPGGGADSIVSGG